MTFQHPEAELFIPDGATLPQALARTTHLAIGAHQDDLEIMALHGILACYRQSDRWFTGVTCTNGSGSPRAGVYAACSDAEMMAIRRQEQNHAAAIGQYAAMAQLHHPSAVVKDPHATALVDDLEALLRATTPEIVYTHNPADKHDTHVGVTRATLAALRRLPAALRPQKVYGCEVWRDLDWLGDSEKVVLDVGGRDHLSAALMGVFDSQIAGGKRYDLATAGRRHANATYAQSHGVDTAESVTHAIDLTPLVADPARDLTQYVLDAIRRFEQDVRARLDSGRTAK